MVRLLRWATFFVLIVVIVGVVLSYPTFHDRLVAPMLAAPLRSPQGLDVTTPATQSTATAIPPNIAIAPMPSAGSTAPAVIIETPTAKTLAKNALAAATQGSETPTPAAIATTSLFPVKTESVTSANTPLVLGPTTEEILAAQDNGSVIETSSQSNLGINSIEVIETPSTQLLTTTISAANAVSVTTSTPTSTVVITTNVAIVVYVTPSTPVPTTVQGKPAAVGEKGYELPGESIFAVPPLPGSQVFNPIPLTGTPILKTPVVTPNLVLTVEVTPALTPITITPVVAISVELTPLPPTTTPLPTGPFANADSPLYSGPSLNDAIVGEVKAGDQLIIVGLYTEGTWYLLVNGLWIPGAVVDNLPFAIPLVFPTITPVPSSTPTVTTTPLPTSTVVGSSTPTPTATSLDQPICDCSGDNLDCLGSVFSSRAQAQQCFEYCFRQTGKDVHNLDPNLNGVACENLP